jgi:hypothetical protein
VAEGGPGSQGLGRFCFFLLLFFSFTVDKGLEAQGRPCEPGLGFLMLFFFVNHLARADKELTGSQSRAKRSQKF